MTIANVMRCDNCREARVDTTPGVSIPYGWVEIVARGTRVCFTEHWCPSCVDINMTSSSFSHRKIKGAT